MNITDNALSHAVESFAAYMAPKSEAELNSPWAWMDYDGDGVRFSIFQVYETLRTAAGQIRAARQQSARPAERAQMVLGQYHTAYRDLNAVLLNVGEPDIDRAPTMGEWAVRRVLGIMQSADTHFLTAIVFARRGEAKRISNEIFLDYFVIDESETERRSQAEGSFDEIREYHAKIHQRIVSELSDLSEEELEQPFSFWESTRFAIEFRLHRFDAHFIQHIVQVEKTLAAIGLVPDEAKRLLRRVYNALAEVEAATIGMEGLPTAVQEEATSEVVALHEEISALPIRY